MFWLLGIYTNSTLSNSWVRCFVNLRYFCILSSFTSYSSFIYTITSLESLWRSRFLALSAFSTLSPISIPPYSASLLVAKNFSWTLYHPPFCLVGEATLVWKSEFDDEVCQSLCLNGCPRLVLDLKLAKLDCPLDHSPCCLGLIHGLLDGLVCHYQNGVSLKVRSQLAWSYY